MNILVVGRGWTGRKVFDEMVFRGHVTTMCSHTDVMSILDYKKWDWVVNCAGVTGFPNVDACETKKIETMNGNAVFPIQLGDACQNLDIKFAHFSSGCIYQGEIDDVNAEPNFFGSVYSLSKAVSDSYLKDKALVFRIRMPFTGVSEHKNYLTKVYNYSKTGKLIDFGQNSLTDLDEAVAVACELIASGKETGAVNLVNSGSIDMHELADMMGINPQWYTKEEFAKATAAGRSTCTIPAHEYMTPVRDALQNAIERMKLGK